MLPLDLGHDQAYPEVEQNRVMHPVALWGESVVLCSHARPAEGARLAHKHPEVISVQARGARCGFSLIICSLGICDSSKLKVYPWLA